MTLLPSRTHLLGLTVLSLMAASVSAQGLLTTKGQVVAEPGDAPGALFGSGVTLGGTSPFTNPVMDYNGSILFRGRLVGTGVSTLNERALFLGRAKGDMQMLMRAGDIDCSGTFPNSQMLQTGSTGQILGSGVFGTLRISPFGEYLLFGSMLYDPTATDGLTTSGTNANNSVLYWGIPGAYQILARRAVTTMPDGAVLLSPNTISHQGSSLNSSGTAIFFSSLSTTLGTPSPAVTAANDTAWIMGTPGSLSYVIRESDLVLGGQCGIKTLGANCVLNDAGQILHDETLSTTLGSSPATTANDSIVFIRTAGVDSVLVREGDVAVDSTGAPLAGVFFGAPTITQSFTATGQTGFQCTMTGAVTTLDDTAVFAGGVGSLVMIAREGQTAPGTGGETLAGIHSITSYSDAGGLVFQASLVSPGIGVTTLNDSAMYICKPGSTPTLIAREGSPAPGLVGYNFGALTGSTNFGSSSQGVTNRRGQILFSSMPVNDGVTQKGATYTYDPIQGLQLQLLEGDVVGANTVGFLPGGVIVSPSGDGTPLGFSADGDFAILPNTASSNFILRGHVGAMVAKPSSIPVGGGTQTFDINLGPTYGSQFYIVLATSLGTRPGFPSPLGPQTVPLNYDPLWTDLSINIANSLVWGNTLGLTDPNGVPFGATPSFTMPPGYPGFLGTTLHHAVATFDFTLLGTFVSEPSALKLY